jgi:hypothetical protein
VSNITDWFFERNKTSVSGGNHEAQASAEIDPHQRVLIRIGKVEYFDTNNDKAINAMREDDPSRRAQATGIADKSDVLAGHLDYSKPANVAAKPELLHNILEGNIDPAAIVTGIDRLHADVALEGPPNIEADNSPTEAIVHDVEEIRERLQALAQDMGKVGHDESVVDNLAA